MSRLFLVFLIALLPLRGWTVERMGVQMELAAAQAQLAAPAQDLSAIPTISAMSAMSDDCALQMATGSDTAGSEAHAPLHQGCQTCELCMALAAMEVPLLLADALCPQAPPALHSDRFASAERARAAKPPIS